jgi:zinc D-Ala-D-Ala dipeptidase
MRVFFIINRIIIITTLLAAVQEKALSQNINVVSKTKIYRQQVINDSNQRMTEVKSRVPLVVYDLRYATINNFTGKRLYQQSKLTFLRLPVVKSLALVQSELNQSGYGLKIFDAYRPYSVTKKMWKLVHDERYVANPAKGSGHNRGLSVDLSVIDMKTGKEIDMGTGFDNFTDSAHHDFRNLPAEVLQNRIMLKTVMEKNGFKALDTEWWHYSWPNDRGYEALDLDFKKLAR